jgi:DNA-binding NarL/FixJ family response regulator
LMKCKLVIADDHKLMLLAIRAALADAPDIEIVGEAVSGNQLLRLVDRTQPDVVLLDLRMPGMDGLRCLDMLRERHPNVKTIALSGTDDRAVVKACFARGAIAYFQKSVDPVDLASVVRNAVAGNIFFAFGDAGDASDEHDFELTPRETEILRALAEGRSNKQIAQQFWLSAQTIKYHLTHIYQKLGVSSRTEAVHQAYEHGLIENPLLREPVGVS